MAQLIDVKLYKNGFKLHSTSEAEYDAALTFDEPVDKEFVKEIARERVHDFKNNPKWYEPRLEKITHAILKSRYSEAEEELGLFNVWNVKIIVPSTD